MVYVSLQAGHVKRVWLGWMAVKSSACERVVLAGRAAASVRWLGRALPWLSDCGGMVSASGRASPSLVAAGSWATQRKNLVNLGQDLVILEQDLMYLGHDTRFLTNLDPDP